MNYKKITDLMIKLKNLFPKDMIITKNKYCIAGNSSYLENYGYCIAMLEDKYEELIKEAFDKNVLITNVDDIKKAFESQADYSAFYRELTEDESYINNSYIFNLLETCSGFEYKRFTDDINFKSIVLDQKGIYDIRLQDNLIIRIGKPALPLISAKTIDNYRYKVDYSETQNLYKLFIYLPFDYFQLYLF